MNKIISLDVAPVDTTTLQNRVYSSLRDTIMNGQAPPGEILTIRNLAAAMGTSVMPVREALARLNAEGAIELRLPSRQVAIPIMSRESVEELYTIRLELEGMAAALAAERITAVELKTLERELVTMDQAIVDGDDLAYLLGNRAFHFGIYHAARAHHLVPIIEMLWLRFGPLLRAPLGDRTLSGRRVKDGSQPHHRAILNALAARNAVGAREALQSDLTEARLWFRSTYDPDAYRPRDDRQRHAR